MASTTKIKKRGHWVEVHVTEHEQKRINKLAKRWVEDGTLEPPVYTDTMIHILMSESLDKYVTGSEIDKEFESEWKTKHK